MRGEPFSSNVCFCWSLLDRSLTKTWLANVNKRFHWWCFLSPSFDFITVILDITVVFVKHGHQISIDIDCPVLHSRHCTRTSPNTASPNICELNSPNLQSKTFHCEVCERLLPPLRRFLNIYTDKYTDMYVNKIRREESEWDLNQG